jgi:hypothetical protein
MLMLIDLGLVGQPWNSSKQRDNSKKPNPTFEQRLAIIKYCITFVYLWHCEEELGGMSIEEGKQNLLISVLIYQSSYLVVKWYFDGRRRVRSIPVGYS